LQRLRWASRSRCAAVAAGTGLPGTASSLVLQQSESERVRNWGQQFVSCQLDEGIGGVGGVDDRNDRQTMPSAELNEPAVRHVRVKLVAWDGRSEVSGILAANGERAAVGSDTSAEDGVVSVCLERGRDGVQRLRAAVGAGGGRGDCVFDGDEFLASGLKLLIRDVFVRTSGHVMIGHKEMDGFNITRDG